MSLRVDAMEVRFQGVLAVDGVSFTAEDDAVVGIIGPNGAGKTTLLDAICGFVPHRGRVFIDDREVTALSPQRRAMGGLSRSFQDARLFPSLTVREAVSVARQRRYEDTGAVAQLIGWPTSRFQERDLRGEVDTALELFGLSDYADKFISELSTGTRRIAELATVHVQSPRVILLDEPSAGIAQREVEALAEVIQRLHELTHASILIVEHDIPMVRLVASRLVALDYGQLVATGPVDEVLNSPAVIASYLGTDDRTIARSGAVKGGRVVEVAAVGDAVAAPPAVPPGLPQVDAFRVPVSRTLAAAGAAALLLLVTAFAAGPALPRVRDAAARAVPSPSPMVTPSPSAAPSGDVPSPQPDVSPAPGAVLPVPPPENTGYPTPPASPTPTPRPSPSPSPSPSCLLPLPAPLPCV